VSLVERLAEGFMTRRPEVAISVTGGGSGVGIASLLDGAIDLCTSSRELEPLERLLALRKEVELIATVFATDALSVIVHADNPVQELDLATIGALYRGELDAWPTAAGTPDPTPVVRYGRQSSSGTYEFFRKSVVKGDYDAEVRQMSGNAHVLDAVERDPSGIGYVAIGMVRASPTRRVRALPIRRDASSPPVSPLDRAAVLRGDYAIARPLLQFTRGRPTGAVLDFLRFETSEAGQALAEDMGFYPVVDAWRAANAHLDAGLGGAA
jgi:phosphate transport system substrate-binding protein